MTSLSRMNRADLNAHAVELGIENAADVEAFPTKEELIEAVNALSPQEAAPAASQSVTTVEPAEVVEAEAAAAEADDVPEVELDANGRIVVPEGFAFNGFGYERLPE